ncbi:MULTISPECIES: type II toxin-antitoxin system HicA family toxin [Desulfobotulus]|uniref:type II toxin-antitoxin system HicA family toxin n=1 Tax=Desulfobotulus TaxID=48001 RepID=UPI0011AA4084
MKKSELVRLLKKAGFQQEQGGVHEIWTKEGFPRIPIPRNPRDIPKGTAEKILKAAGIK